MAKQRLPALMLAGAAIAVLGACAAQPHDNPEIRAAATEAAAAAQDYSDRHGGSDTRAAVRDTAMGAVCWAAILEAMSGYGQRCISNENNDFRAGLTDAIQRLDRKFLASGWTQQGLAAFKAQMSEARTPTATLCANKDAMTMYRAFEKGGAAPLLQQSDELIARTGPPAWGTCL